MCFVWVRVVCVCRALLSVCRALLSVYRVLLSIYRTLHRHVIFQCVSRGCELSVPLRNLYARCSRLLAIFPPLFQSCCFPMCFTWVRDVCTMGWLRSVGSIKS